MAQEMKGRLLAGLAHSLDLPADVILDFPRTTLIGNSRLCIENHKGILAYAVEQIRVRTRQGEVLISGRRLKIDTLDATEIVIVGIIQSIEFVTGRG